MLANWTWLANSHKEVSIYTLQVFRLECFISSNLPNYRWLVYSTKRVPPRLYGVAIIKINTMTETLKHMSFSQSFVGHVKFYSHMKVEGGGRHHVFTQNQPITVHHSSAWLKGRWSIVQVYLYEKTTDIRVCVCEYVVVVVFSFILQSRIRLVECLLSYAQSRYHGVENTS